MARYIDADALLSKLPDSLPYKASVKRVLIQAPTELPRVTYTPSPKGIEGIITEYESPITMQIAQLTSDIQRQEDAHLMKCVHGLHIDVDKEELIKALRYDRDQYEKGFAAGRCAANIDVAREIFEEMDGITDLFAQGLICELKMYDMLAELKKKYTEGE